MCLWSVYSRLIVLDCGIKAGCNHPGICLTLIFAKFETKVRFVYLPRAILQTSQEFLLANLSLSLSALVLTTNYMSFDG